MAPLRAANELSDVAAGPGRRLGDLHATGAAADDPPALARIGHGVIPARRVKGRAGETFAPSNVGKERLVEKTRGTEQDVGHIGVTFGRLEVPTTLGEPRRDDLLVEADEIGEAAVACDLLDI